MRMKNAEAARFPMVIKLGPLSQLGGWEQSSPRMFPMEQGLGGQGLLARDIVEMVKKRIGKRIKELEKENAQVH